MAENFTADLTFDRGKVQDGSSLFARPKGPHGSRVPKVDPQKGGENATFGSSGVTAKPGFGPNGPGAASKKAGKDYGSGLPVRTGQDS